MNRVERASRSSSPYDDRVADSNLIEHALKLGAIAIAARLYLGVYCTVEESNLQPSD
jgi:hypothetical protein